MRSQCRQRGPERSDRQEQERGSASQNRKPKRQTDSECERKIEVQFACVPRRRGRLRTVNVFHLEMDCISAFSASSSLFCTVTFLLLVAETSVFPTLIWIAFVRARDFHQLYTRSRSCLAPSSRRWLVRL